MTTFPIILSGNDSDHAKHALELEVVLLQCPKHLKIQLISAGAGISAETALTYIAVLADAPCEVTVSSYGNLAGAGAFALWLAAAPERTIRQHAWVYVPPFTVSGSGDRAENKILPAWVPSDEWDYDACLRVIDEHVALDLVLGNRLTVRDLRDLYLLEAADIPFNEEVGANPKSSTERAGTSDSDREGLVW